VGFDLAAAIHAGVSMVIHAPARVFSQDPIATLTLVPMMVLVWAIVGGAIARASACEFAQRVFLSWPGALAFGLSRALGLALSLLLPIVFVALLVVLIALVGSATLALPYLNVLGALLYLPMLVIALVGVVALLAFAIGHVLLVPAIACEGTDAIDAIQRMYHYVLNRTLRLVVYLLLLVVQGVLLILVAGVIASSADALVSGAIAWMGPASASRVLEGGDALTGADAIAGGILSLWKGVPGLLVAALGISYIHAGGTVLYLLIRDINDHQDPSEIWMETLIEGTQAERQARAD